MAIVASTDFSVSRHVSWYDQLAGKMNPFVEQLCDGLRRCDVRQERLLVAVSGGADSVALLRGLVEVSSSFSLGLFVAHLNHKLRGADSDGDADWVKNQLCAALSVPSEIGVIAAGELAGNSAALEENARRLRYKFLEQVASRWNCSVIAVAHTADDQTETVLHHLFRGTGIAGLRGIPPVRLLNSGQRIVRPMLQIRRKQVEDYLQQLGQSFRVDSTNIDTGVTRNWFRHVLLPLLRAEVNPEVDSAISRLAEQANEIEEWLTEVAASLLQSALKDVQPDSCRLEVQELASQPRHIVRELFRELWKRQQWPRQGMGFEQWNRLANAIVDRQTITLPGKIEARFHGENLLVLRKY